MPANLYHLAATEEPDGDFDSTGLEVFLRLPGDKRLDILAFDPQLSPADAQEAGKALAEAVSGGDLLLFEASAQIAPMVTGADTASCQRALGVALDSLKEVAAERYRLLACRLDDEAQEGLWGDLYNCEPDSRSPLVVALRANTGRPAALRELARPDAEYRFTSARKQSARGNSGASGTGPRSGITLESSGVATLSLQQAHALAAEIDALTIDEPVRLLWVMWRGEVKFFAAQPLSARPASQVRRKYSLTGQGKALGQGGAVGHGIVSGAIRIAAHPEEVKDGDILLVDRVDPAWHSALARAAGVITKRGGRTSHAALMAAELGIPAIVGCDLPALETGAEVTMDCEHASKGRVLEGDVAFEVREIDLAAPPDLPLDILLDLANPYRAFSLAEAPNKGIGLVRQEFIVGHMIGMHPRALLSPERLNRETRRQLDEKTADYDDPVELFVDRLCQGIATLATAVDGRPVMLRLSDFKSDEYSRLIGGDVFEPVESNPMLGLRGAARYLQHDFKPCLEMECRAVKRVREELGFAQLSLLIPFVRTPEEGVAVLEMLDDFGLKRGQDGLQIHMMCEVPSNLVLAEEFADLFDGFSVGTSDLTQLMLGVDRGSPMVAHLFDEGHPALLKALQKTIEIWHDKGSHIGVCGRGISANFPLALWFARQEVHSLTVEPQRAADMWLTLHDQL